MKPNATVHACGLATLTLCAALASAQSSSLYVSPEEVPALPAGSFNRQGPTPMSPALVSTSLSAVLVPEPRQFAIHDLVTIIVRESTEAESESALDTKKDSSLSAEISDFPDLRMLKYFVDLVSATDLDEDPKVAMTAKKDFKGDGSYERKDTFTSRITARIIDVKPNGTIVLEARKYIKSDKETLNMVLTGACRAQDVASDNTVLSTQIYDLHLEKEHKGEVRGATKKGFLTKFFEGLFAF